MNNIGVNYFIENIKSGRIIVGNRWANGKLGWFEDFNKDCQYRFCETDRNGHRDIEKLCEQKTGKVLACGFVGWIIRFWREDIGIVYSGYLQYRLNQYKNEHKFDLGVLERDLECEFYNQYEKQEMEWVKQSEAIFEYITNEESDLIKSHVDYYFKYVNKSKTMHNPTSQPTTKDSKGNSERAINEDGIRELFDAKLQKSLEENKKLSQADFIILRLKEEVGTIINIAAISLIFYKSPYIKIPKNEKTNDKIPFKTWQKTFYGLMELSEKSSYFNETKLNAKNKIEYRYDDFRYLRPEDRKVRDGYEDMKGEAHRQHSTYKEVSTSILSL